VTFKISTRAEVVTYSMKEYHDRIVVSCITVLWMCVWRTGYVSTIVCAKLLIACTLPLRHNRKYSVKY
jgi:hypothetical protein